MCYSIHNFLTLPRVWRLLPILHCFHNAIVYFVSLWHCISLEIHFSISDPLWWDIFPWSICFPFSEYSRHSVSSLLLPYFSLLHGGTRSLDILQKITHASFGFIQHGYYSRIVRADDHYIWHRLSILLKVI